MSSENLLPYIAGMAVVTYLPRAIPLVGLTGRKLPGAVVAWLRLVPVSVLSALLVPAILAPEGRKLWISIDNPYMLSAVPAAIVALKTRNPALTVIAGMLVHAIITRTG